MSLRAGQPGQDRAVAEADNRAAVRSRLAEPHVRARGRYVLLVLARPNEGLVSLPVSSYPTPPVPGFLLYYSSSFSSFYLLYRFLSLSLFL